MTTSEPSIAKTFAEFREELLIELGERAKDLRVKIAHATAEMHNQRIQSQQHVDRMDNDSARASLVRAGHHHQEAQALGKQLRDLDVERESIVSGKHPRMANISMTDGQRIRDAWMLEHGIAVARFKELTKPDGELVQLARQLLQLGGGGKSPPPQLAQEIVNSTK